MLYHLLVLFGVVFGATADAAASCPCGDKPGLEQALADSSTVFLGRVEEQSASPLKPGYSQVKLVVLRRYKMPEELEKAQVLTVYTPLEAKTCGYKFQSGFDYLVYTEGNPAFLKITSCGRTEILEKATLDQQKLIRLTGSGK